MNKLSPQAKSVLIKTYPELGQYFASMETNSMLSQLLKNQAEEKMAVKLIKGERGDKGEKGDSPTSQELISLIKPLIPEPIKGEKGDEGKRGRDGLTPIKGIHYKDGEPGRDGSTPLIDYIAVAEAVHDPLKRSILKEIPKMEDIRKYLTDKASKGRLKSGDFDMNDLRWHGGGLSTVAHDNSLTGTGTTSNPLSVVGGISSGYQIPTSGSLNQGTFVWAVSPNVIVVDGVPRQRVQTDGTVNWTGTTTTVFASAPVPTFDIYATA